MYVYIWKHVLYLKAEKFSPLYKQQSSILDLFFLTSSVLKHIMMCNCYRLSFFKLVQPSLFWQAQNARESSTSITNILLSSSFWEQSRWKDLLVSVQFWTFARDCVFGRSCRMASSGISSRSSGHCQHLSFCFTLSNQLRVHRQQPWICD